MKYFNITFIILIFLIGCSKKNEDQILNEIENSYKKKEYARVLELVKEYDELENYSESYLKALLIKQNILLNNLNNSKAEENYKEAIKTYLLINDKYPNSKEGKNAYFIIGFIYSEYLKDFQNAKLYYQKFIDKYPNDELSAQAKIEIENMGKNLNNLIN